MRTKLFTAFYILLLPSFSFSQIKIDTIKSNERSDELFFPLVRHPKPAIAQKINYYLQSNIWDNTTKKISPEKLFDRRKFIMNDSTTRSGITNCVFSPILNTQKLLSLQIDFEYMAAYPSSSSKYFNFNAQNGEPILVEDLFTKSGLESLKKKVNSGRQKLVKNYVDGIRKDKTEDLIDDLDYISETLTECIKYGTLEGFAILKKTLVFHKPECFPHAVLNYSTNLDVELSIAEVSPWLNDFGKRALLNNSASIEKDFIPGLMKPFYGTIDGKYPIVLQLDDIFSEKSVSGFYYYASQGICIRLSGLISGNIVNITEFDDEDNETATFNGNYDGKQITGIWTPKTGKALPFTLKN